MVQKFLRDSVALPKPVNCELDDNVCKSDNLWEQSDLKNMAPDTELELLTKNSGDQFEILYNDKHISSLPNATQSHMSTNKNDTLDDEIAQKQLMSDPWSCLPPLNLAEIDWTSDSYEVPKAKSKTSDGGLEALHQQQWPGVNGQYDRTGNWCDWTQTHSMPTHGGDLHILPYVDIDL